MRSLSKMPCALGAALLAALASPPGAIAQDATVQKVTVKAVTRFGFNKTEIPAKDQAAILAEVGQLKDVTWQKVTATGHTDSIGPEPVNEKISRERADAVKAYLVGKGLDPGMIATDGKASEAPIATNDTASGRAKNRRTEIEFQGIRSTAPAK